MLDFIVLDSLDEGLGYQLVEKVVLQTALEEVVALDHEVLGFLYCFLEELSLR
jgi:hypothetical protein